MILTNSYLPYMDKLSFFRQKTQRNLYMEGASFIGDLVQVLVLFCLSESFLKKTHETIRQLFSCYQRFPTVMQKTIKMSFQFRSVQKLVLNLRNRN